MLIGQHNSPTPEESNLKHTLPTHKHIHIDTNIHTNCHKYIHIYTNNHTHITIIIIIIIITEHLILRPKMQANSKAHAFLLPIMFSTEEDEFSAFS